MRKLNRIAKRMQKMAWEWDVNKNLDQDLTPENWKLIEEDGKLRSAIESLMEGPQPKLSNGLVEGVKYAIDNNINGKKWDYFITYIDGRKTAKSDTIKSDIINFVDVFGPIDYANKMDKDTFVYFFNKGGNRSIKSNLESFGETWNTAAAEEVLTLLDIYFGGHLTNEGQTYKLVDVAYVYFFGGDDKHIELMKNWRKPNNLSDEIKHEIRNLIADNSDMDKLQFITTYADLLDEGDPTTIVDRYDGDVNRLYDAVETGTLDDVLYPGLVEGKLQRAKRTASLKTRRMHTATARR